MTVLLGFAASIRADDVFPKRPEFALYNAMLSHSPFAVATAAAAPAVAPDFARDLYVANAGHLEDGDFITIASTTDRNFKEYLDTKGANDSGFAITDIKWSDRPGETKVTITKDGKYATLSFNQALMAQPGPGAGQQMLNLPQPQPFMPQQPFVPQPPAAFKPAPIPSLPPAAQGIPQQTPPTNRFRSRGLIQRNPAVAVPTPNVPTQPDDQD
ncbi:MAG: hypothetical protein ACR2FX_04080 [Chthoniobacterales bacterium]